MKVWLIEVNSAPDMSYRGQPILKELVKNSLTDLAKVVVDWDANINANTGDYELVIRSKNEVTRPKQVNMGQKFDLTVEGKKMPVRKMR